MADINSGPGWYEVINPRNASQGTLRCSTSPVKVIPASSTAVTISPRPWFHSCVVLCVNTTSVSTYVPPSS